jgi:hypothetical protein
MAATRHTGISLGSIITGEKKKSRPNSATIIGQIDC